VDDHDLGLPEGSIDLADLGDLSEPIASITTAQRAQGAPAATASPTPQRTRATVPITIRVPARDLAAFRALAARGLGRHISGL
jgi:hypothetical protein